VENTLERIRSNTLIPNDFYLKKFMNMNNNNDNSNIFKENTRKRRRTNDGFPMAPDATYLPPFVPKIRPTMMIFTMLKIHRIKFYL